MLKSVGYSLCFKETSYILQNLYDRPQNTSFYIQFELFICSTFDKLFVPCAAGELPPRGTDKSLGLINPPRRR
jgi:hypothetical protein